MPVDTALRVLELALLLDQHWTFHKMPQTLALVTHVAYNTIEFTKSMLEWLSESVMQTFDARRENPFQFRSLRLCHALEDLDRFPGPYVVLASPESLSCGFSRELFLRFAPSPENLILLTQATHPSSPAAALLAATAGEELTMTFYRKVPLEGEELARFLEEDARRREKEREASALERDDESDDEDEAMDGVVSDASLARTDVVITDHQRSSLGFFKQTRGFAMFPLVDRRLRFDEYGEVIRPGEFASQDGAEHAASSRREDDEKRRRQEAKLKREKEAQTKTPDKWVPEVVRLQVNCQRVFLDFEGLSDGRSMKTILSNILPKKLVLVRGSDECVDLIKQFCLSSADLTKDVFSPHRNEWIDVSSATNIYPIKLTDALFSALNIYKVRVPSTEPTCH